MNGHGTVIHTNMSPVMKKFFWEGKGAERNPALAKEILQKKGLLPMEFILKVPNSSKIYLDTAQALREQLKEIGVQVNLETIEWASWLSDVYTNRNYTASMAGLSGKMEPDAILRRYTSDYKKNFTNFHNENYDKLIAEAKLSADEQTQIKNYKEAEKILQERSEERRVGKECRSRWSPYHYKIQTH